tara:strand:+ start:3403 stop:3597 length:195 start_codon:yes stop_codon:yes gene_type:complete
MLKQSWSGYSRSKRSRIRSSNDITALRRQLTQFADVSQHYLSMLREIRLIREIVDFGDHSGRID